MLSLSHLMLLSLVQLIPIKIGCSAALMKLLISHALLLGMLLHGPHHLAMQRMPQPLHLCNDGLDKHEQMLISLQTHAHGGVLLPCGAACLGSLHGFLFSHADHAFQWSLHMMSHAMPMLLQATLAIHAHAQRLSPNIHVDVLTLICPGKPSGFFHVLEK